MKLFIILFSLAFSALSFASESIESSKDPGVQYFDLITDIHITNSESAGLEAKVIEVVASEGSNPTRMFLVLSTGYLDTKVFELGVMMYQVTRITFLTKEIIVVNYTQTLNNDDGTSTVVNKSMKIKVSRNENNALANKIEVLD